MSVHQKDFQTLIDWFSTPKKSNSFPAVFANIYAYKNEVASGSPNFSGYVWFMEPKVGIRSFIPGDLQGILQAQGYPPIVTTSLAIFTIEFDTVGPSTFRLASPGWPNYGNADITTDVGALPQTLPGYYEYLVHSL